MASHALRGAGPTVHLWVLAGVLGLVAAALAVQAQQPSPDASPAAAAEAPLAIVRNAGQTDAAVRYMARSAGQTIYFTEQGALLDLRRGGRGMALQLRFRGANPHPEIVPERRAGGRVSFIAGGERHTGLAAHSQLRYRNLWPGIDMVFRGKGGQLKYEFLVRPGASPGDIRLAYAGADSISLGAGGALLIDTPLGSLRDSPPVARQGGREVASRYAVSASSYGFALGSYDRSRSLVIDPGLIYSTLVAGFEDDLANAVAVDGDGNTYLTGYVTSADYPTTPGAYDETDNGNWDAFVTKLGPFGGFVYSTYLGGDSDLDIGMDVAVDGDGNAFVMGSTRSSDFPTTPGAYHDSTNPGAAEYQFVTKLDPTGSSLVYSTLVGIGVTSQGTIHVDGSGHAYIGGQTFDPAYPTTPGAYSTATGNGFVTKLNPTGTGLVYSTHFPAVVQALTVDPAGNAYLTGSAGFAHPTTPGAYDTTANSSSDAYVTKLNPTGSALVYSTYLGSGTADHGSDIALDSAGNAYVTGGAGNTDFPTTPGAYSTTKVGSTFVTKLNPTGSALVYSTFLPGAGGNGIAVDGDGHAYVTGFIDSTTLPATSDAVDGSFNGSEDAFVIKLTPAGNALAYATYLGGSARDIPSEIAIDDQQNAYVAGHTFSSNFPTTPGARGYIRQRDVFATKLRTRNTAYARPSSAPLARFDLVVAFKPCTDANEMHGPPLSYPSCGGPQMASDFLTVGTFSVNGKATLNEGYVRLRALPGNPATPATDEADVRLDLYSDDVFTKALDDYAGELRAQLTVRITDRDNALGSDPPEPGTVIDVPLGATYGCTPTTDPADGSVCSATTSFDAITPGLVKEGRRTVWAVGQVRVFDGGPDGDGDTVAGNTLFATQGVFIP